jgi:arylsulfatase A-like enzyme
MKKTILLIASFFISHLAISEENVRPNVILILSDDQGFTDYGFMGHKVVKTPNIDRMASQSMLYTRGYVMPVCSPSLATLLTGQLPHVHGITGNDLSKKNNVAVKTKGPGDRSPLAHQLLGNSMILPKALTAAGYLTFQTGKLWNVTAQEVGFTAGMTNAEGRHGGDGLEIGRKTMKPMFDFMDNAQSQKKPFFVWYAPMLPHQPHNPPKELLAHFQDKGLSVKAATYYAMVEWFDQTCGQLDDYLTKNKLADNTVIIYMADNGWDAEEGKRAKLSPYELGIRTPMFVRWPKKVKAMRDEETLASIIDFVPTVLNACGLKVPSDLPGLDLTNREAMTARKSVFVEAYTHDIAALGQPEKSLVTQVIINGWSKLLLPGQVVPDKAFTSAPSSAALYDLKSDPMEKNDLSTAKPDEVTRLKSLQNAQWNAHKK